MSVAFRVGVGATFLDHIVPTWYLYVNTESLNLQSHTCCVLGQVFGSFRVGLISVGIPRQHPNILSHGFGGSYSECDELDQAWKDEISKRVSSNSILTPFKQGVCDRHSWKDDVPRQKP